MIAPAVTLLPQPLSPDQADQLARSDLEAYPVHSVDDAFLRGEVHGQVGETKEGVARSAHARSGLLTLPREHAAVRQVFPAAPRRFDPSRWDW